MPFRGRMRSSNRSGFRSIRRETRWIASADQTAAVALPAASARLDQSLTTIELALRPFTIVRTVGVLFWSTDQTAASEQPYVALGGAVVSEQAVAIGVTAVPTPIADEASDLFFLYETAAAFILTASNASISSPANVSRYFDSRAQRKVEDGQDVVFVLENGEATMAGLFILKFRMLVKLH